MLSRSQAYIIVSHTTLVEGSFVAVTSYRSLRGGCKIWTRAVQLKLEPTLDNSPQNNTSSHVVNTSDNSCVLLRVSFITVVQRTQRFKCRYYSNLPWHAQRKTSCSRSTQATCPRRWHEAQSRAGRQSEPRSTRKAHVLRNLEHARLAYSWRKSRSESRIRNLRSQGMHQKRSCSQRHVQQELPGWQTPKLTTRSTTPYFREASCSTALFMLSQKHRKF